MEIEVGIALFLDNMYAYQKKHNIKKQCITHTQLLYDAMNHSNLPVKAKAVIVYHIENDVGVATVHMVVEREDGVILDPSYDIHSKKADYFQTFADANKIFTKMNNGLSKKDFVTIWLKFINYADMINNGMAIVADSEYYHKIADYMDTVKY
jgi:hypothetical protein